MPSQRSATVLSASGWLVESRVKRGSGALDSGGRSCSTSRVRRATGAPVSTSRTDGPHRPCSRSASNGVVRAAQHQGVDGTIGWCLPPQRGNVLFAQGSGLALVAALDGIGQPVTRLVVEVWAVSVATVLQAFL